MTKGNIQKHWLCINVLWQFGRKHLVLNISRCPQSQQLATLYQAQGNYPEVLSLLQRALVINEKVFGSKHPAVANILNNLGSVVQRIRELSAGGKPV
jgi:hypothetical protein